MHFHPTAAALACLLLLLGGCGGGSSSSSSSPAPTPPDPVNRAPTASAGPDQTVIELTTVQLAGSGSDPDAGTTLTYAWTQTGGVSVDLSDAAIARPTFTAPDVATGTTEVLTFELTVSDGQLSDMDSVVITAQEQPTSVTISGTVSG